ncbi:restriction endonuclease subunit S [Stutzerimonas stutzeri]|uniref:restriction endonuclease subunit S n=1 Tax=Stutzerimonas sp. S1 TaxID=3030652 RepID=UPI0022259DA1|nr:restriction endonuclease subunit S [Stutzerimonas sp. S1]MCW3147025.1 restriction endonuclease subunit S [Stutzerimonas sp. S1]
MSLPRYQELKDSGIDYLGIVPSDWSIKRLGDIVAFAQGKAHEPYVDDDGDYICVNSRFVSTAGKTIKNCTVNLSPASLDDILMVMSDLPNGRALARAYYVRDNQKYAVNQRVCRITAKKAHSRFLFHLLDRHPGLMQNDDGVNQTHLSNDDFLKLKLYLPSFSEQTQIARFLDHETARIDALIEEQQRLIELLKEKRQAVISHAVTKGLDPAVPMKDSGVEWLGEVPAHWVLEPLKYQCRFSGGGTPSKENLDYWKGDIPWVSPKDMKTFWIAETEDKITEAAVVESSTNMVEPGALLLVVRSGILQRTIPVGINTVTVSLNQDMKALRFIVDGMAEFVSFLIKGFEPSILLEWRKQGATVESIEHEYMANTVLAVPPPIELNAIVQKLRAIEVKYEALQAESMHLIATLQERRSALISAAVTGKIDVRGWQPPTSIQAPELAVAEAN